MKTCNVFLYLTTATIALTEKNNLIQIFVYSKYLGLNFNFSTQKYGVKLKDNRGCCWSGGGRQS